MKMPAELRSLCRGYTEQSVRWMAGIAQHSESDSARVAAITALWERGWGKAPTTHTGADGDGDIKVVIRHIIEGPSGAPLAIEHQTVEHAAVTPDDTDST